jgi:hypothetical protein
LAVAAVVGAATGYLAAVDPSRPGHYPGCPILALTGAFCPGCGGLRAVHDLTHGDVGAALSSNLVVTLAVPVAVVLWLAWLRRSLANNPPETSPAEPDPKRRTPAGSRIWGPVALAIGLILFAVLRNLPGFEALAP